MANFEDFNNSYELTLLEKYTTASLDVKEHLWIQKLRTRWTLMVCRYYNSALYRMNDNILFIL